MAFRKLAEEVIVLVLVGAVICLARAVGYVIKIQVQTGSKYLLATILTVALTTALAVVTWAAWLGVLTGILAITVLVVAKVEDSRLEPAQRDWSLLPPSPFEDSRR